MERKPLQTGANITYDVNKGTYHATNRSTTVLNLTNFAWGPGNNWDPDEIIRNFQREQLYSFDDPFTIVLIVLYSLAFLTGFLGNIMVIAVVIRHRSMRTLTNMFLVNLAIGDFLVIVICMPLTLGSLVYHNWVYGASMCKLTPFVQGVSVAVSVLTLLAISLDRFLAILKPMKARIIFSKRTVKFILGAIWLLAIALFVPMLFVNNTTKEIYLGGLFEKTICSEQWQEISSKQIYSLFVFLTLYLIPLLIMTVAYIKTGSILWRGDKRFCRSESLTGTGQEHAQNKILRGRQRVVKMLISIVIMFALSWLPYHVINIWTDITINPDESDQSDPTHVSISKKGYPLAQWLGLANSASNPICYCFMSKSFRGAFISVFKCDQAALDSYSGRRQNNTHARSWKNSCSLYASQADHPCLLSRIMKSVRRSNKNDDSKESFNEEEASNGEKKELVDKITAI
jgi:hypothetical protein